MQYVILHFHSIIYFILYLSEAISSFIIFLITAINFTFHIIIQITVKTGIADVSCSFRIS
jgi:hypothetical protein